MSRKEHGRSVLAHADRFVREIDVDRARQRVSDDERRRGEIVRTHFGMNAAFEIAIAAQDAGDDQIVVLNRLRYNRRQGAAVADARRATVADEMEAQLLERAHEVGAHQIIGYRFRTGRQAGFDPGLALQTALDGFLGDQPGSDQHIGIGRIRASS